MLITYEATRDLPLTTKEVETPICRTIAPTLKGKKFAVVPILRAGLGLVDGVLRMVPSARVGHIGMFRDEMCIRDRSRAASSRVRRDNDGSVPLTPAPRTMTASAGRGVMSPVSYTHLDVYKRQVYTPSTSV